MIEGPDPIFPPDRVPGCLERKSAPGEWCPMLRSAGVPIIPRSQWSDIASRFSDGRGLRPFVREVLNQGSVGSCATEATAGAMMIARAFAGLPHVSLNPWFIYHHTSGGVDRGSSIDENLRFARDKGVATTAVWPRSRGWRTRPSAEAYADAMKNRIVEFYDIETVEEAVSAIYHGWPVVYGARGHAVVRVAIDADLNSWGTGWGDGGFGQWVPLSSINFRYGAFAVRTTLEV